MLKIWGRMSSINVKKVVWAVQELGLVFERLEAGGQFGLVKTPEYMRMNPNSLVPVIDDDGFVLWESNVITRYLCAKHSTGNLYPTGLQERFNAERWMDWQQTTVNPAGRDAFIQLIRTPLDQRNQQLIDQSVIAMQPKLAMLEAHFSTSLYAVGNTFTMADIPLALEIQRWWGLPFDAARNASPRDACPHVHRWYTAILARPASRGVLDLALA